MSGSMPQNPPLSEVARLMQDSQRGFLLGGGAYRNALNKMRTDGLLDAEYVYREYPKMLRVNQRTETTKRSVVNVDKEKIEWEETREVWDEVIVNSEEEEERVLNGGKTAVQIEEERQALLATAKQRGVRYDPTWSTLRLQRELGVPTASEAPAAFDEVDELRRQVAKAEEALALRAQLAKLNAGLAEPAIVPVDDEVEGLRAQLQSLGVRVDGRWSPARLRQELDRATAPELPAV